MEYHPNTTRSLAVGIHMVGIMVGSGLGFWKGWVAEHHYWNTIFIILGIFGIIYAVLLSFTLKDAPKNAVNIVQEKAGDKVSFFHSVKELFKLRSYIFMLYSLTKSFTDTNMMPILCLITYSRHRATGYGILNLVAAFIGGIGLYAGGVSRYLHINLSTVYQIAALTIIISIVVLIAVSPKYIAPE